MRSKAWRLAFVFAILGAAAALLALTARQGHETAVEPQAQGIERDAPVALDATRENATKHVIALAAATTATSFGPRVGSGTYLGVSSAVADLPLPQVPVVTAVNPRDHENLVAAAGSSSTAC